MVLKDRRRFAVAVWPVALAGLVLGACGGSDAAGPSVSTVDLSSTAFVTRPPETTSTTIAGVVDDSIVAGEQEYTIQSGDFPLRVADLFGVSVEDIGAYNGWAGCTSLNCPQFPGIGSIIKIPPGATNLNVSTPVDPGVEVVTGGEAEQPVGDTIPEAGDNCAPGSYTIEEGDTTRLAVANKFDVTVEAMDAANAQTNGYSAFYPGLQIVIPAKSDC
jgi:LysM repeat protein